MQVLYDVTCKVFNNTLLTNFHIICLPKYQLTVAPTFSSKRYEFCVVLPITCSYLLCDLTNPEITFNQRK